MPTPAEYQAAVEKAVTNSARLDSFVNGPVGGTVATDNGTLPTLASLQVNTATATTSQLTAATNAINTQGKYAGKCVFNTTTSKPVWASGSSAIATWLDATGATAHTPA